MTRKPVLAILTYDFYPTTGGVQAYLLEISRRMADSYRVAVLTPQAGSLQKSIPIEKIVLPSDSPAAFRRSLIGLKPDRILVGHCHPKLFLAAIGFDRYAAIAYGNDYRAAQGRWHAPLFNFFLRRAHPLITISEDNAAVLARLDAQAKHIIPPGTDPLQFTPAQQPPPTPTLLTVGRLVSRKGHDTVLRALPAVRRKFPDLRYKIAGTGPELPKLKAMAAGLGVAGCVDFLGFVPDDHLPDLYRNATVFVMPVREEAEVGSVEGYGIVYLEAGASGLPVIAGKSGGAQEAVKHGETGLLVPPDSPEDLTRALLDLLADPETRARMGAAGRKWVETEMNWDRAAIRMVEALQ